MPRTPTLAVTILLALGAALWAPLAADAQPWIGGTSLGLEVENKKGKALEGAEISLVYVETEPFDGPPVIVTNAEGFAEAVRIAEGSWRIEIKSGDRTAYTAVIRIVPGKKPAITAGPIRDATTEPLKVKFLKSPDTIERPAARTDARRGDDRASRRDEDRESRKDRRTRRQQEPPPPAEPAPVVPAPQPAPVTPAPQPAPVVPAPQPTPVTPEPQPAPSTPPPTPEPDPQPVAVTQPVAEPEPVAPRPEPQPVQPKAEPVQRPQPEQPEAQPTQPKLESSEPPAVKPQPVPVTPPPPVAPPETPPVQELAPIPVAPPPPVEQPSETTPEEPLPEPEPLPQPEPQPTAPPTTPPPEEPVAPPVAKPAPTPEPGSTSPVDQRREIRAFTDAACPGCKAGEWAMIVEQGAAPGRKACPKRARDLEDAFRDLVRTRSRDLPEHEGAIVELLPEEALPAFQGYLGTDSNCQVVATVLPRGARFAGYGYEVRDASGGGPCQVGQDCEVGQCRFLDHPIVAKDEETTVVFSIFENRNPDTARTARVILYFHPPRGAVRR